MGAIKNDEDIALIKQSATILSKVHGLIAKELKPGIKTKILDNLAESFITDNGAKPSFKGYKGFPCTLCVSVNDSVVHGIPSAYELKEGDIASIDCGVYYKGFHSDMAFTYPIGQVSEEAMKLLDITKKSLYLGIAAIKVGERLGDVSYVIQKYIESEGYSIVRELGGHGIGKELHEDPHVPNYGKRGSGPKLKKGMILAIEPMVNLGNRAVVRESNGVFRTSDRKLSAHFEHTVAVLENHAEILTTYKYIEEIFKF